MSRINDGPPDLVNHTDGVGFVVANNSLGDLAVEPIRYLFDGLNVASDGLVHEGVSDSAELRAILAFDGFLDRNVEHVREGFLLRGASCH
jgi:hypothetical protein